LKLITISIVITAFITIIREHSALSFHTIKSVCEQFLQQRHVQHNNLQLTTADSICG